MRDGCYGQINAASQIDAWAKAKGRSLLLGKYSAGMSMTESLNDLGYGHANLKALIEHKDFKCKQYDDPPGACYAAAKKYLRTHLAPASFKTYWTLICAFEPFILKAMTPTTILSAAKAAGFDGEKINTLRIMSHNLEFAQIQPPKRAQDLLDTIETVFTPYWWQHGLIHENIFNEVFDGETDIDTLKDRNGKPLNVMATNRQRFMLDNHILWIAEIERRKQAEDFEREEKARDRATRDALAAALPAKARQCSDLSCQCTIDITTPALKSANEKTWRKCSGKGCATWGCPIHFDNIAQHETFCGKIRR